MKLPNSTQKLIILSLTLLAFVLRAYRLDYQSYWIDEAWTVYFAHLSPAELWRLLQTTEIMPPLYHPSTIYWIKLVGDSEYALRFYSLVFGVMAVPFTYRLGKDLGDSRLGLVAAVLMSLAPYQIWHSQEARMYSMLTAASAMSMWGFVNLWRRSGRRWWLVYAAGTEWAIMTHYHGVILIGIQGLFLLLTWRRHWRGYLHWGASLAVIFLVSLPWLIFGSNLLQSYVNWIEQPTLWDTFTRSAKAYSVGELVPQPQAIPLVLVFVVVYGLGLIYAATRQWGSWRGPETLALLLAYTIAPHPAAWIYGQLRTAVYLERYMILVQVGYLLTVAMGILAIADFRFWILDFGFQTPVLRVLHSRPRVSKNLLAGILLLTLTGIDGWVLYHHYYDPLYAKPDWRAVARTIEDFALPGDAVLLTGDGGENAFNFYYRGDLPVYASFNLLPPLHPDYKKGRKGPAEADQIMADIAANHRRIWYTPYGVDIDATLEQWLATHTYPAWHSWLGKKRLALYASHAASRRIETLDATFVDTPGQELTLVSVAVPDDPVAAGDLLPLELTWQATTALTRDYQLSLRLVNSLGDIFAQSDWPPLAAAGPTSTWSPAQPITDRRSLWLPPDTPPGKYGLQFVVYDPLAGQAVGQPAIISDVAVGPARITPPLEALSIPNSTRQPLGDLTLVGYAAPEKIQPGREMWLWLYWQATPSAAPSVNGVRLSLSSDGETVTTDFLLDGSVGPLDSWQSGQVRRAVYHLPTNPHLDGRQAKVEIALVLSNGEVAAETTLGQVDLDIRPRQFDTPPIEHRTDLAFGRTVRLKLLGYDLPAPNPAPGDTLPVTLYWQAEREMDTDYTVFVQLLNSAGLVVAQVDRLPLAGAAPTTTWLPGEILADPYTLALPPDLPSGDYRLISGLYHAPTGQRLPLTSDGDFVELETVTVK